MLLVKAANKMSHEALARDFTTRKSPGLNMMTLKQNSPKLNQETFLTTTRSEPPHGAENPFFRMRPSTLHIVLRTRLSVGGILSSFWINVVKARLRKSLENARTGRSKVRNDEAWIVRNPAPESFFNKSDRL